MLAVLFAGQAVVGRRWRMVRQRRRRQRIAVAKLSLSSWATDAAAAPTAPLLADVRVTARSEIGYGRAS